MVRILIILNKEERETLNYVKLLYKLTSLESAIKKLIKLKSKDKRIIKIKDIVKSKSPNEMRREIKNET